MLIVKLSLRLRVSEITKRVVKNFEMKKKLFTFYSSNGLILQIIYMKLIENYILKVIVWFYVIFTGVNVLFSR